MKQATKEKREDFKRKLGGWLRTAKWRIAGAWYSWTIWFNTVGMALISASLAEPMLLTWLTAHGFIHFWIAGNIILRFKTNSDLADK